MNPLSLLGTVFSTVTSIYSTVKTDNYRSSVLTTLQNIESNLTTIEDDLDKILADVRANALKIAFNGAYTNINSIYSDKQIQAYLNSSSGFPDDFPKEMMEKIKDNVKIYLDTFHNLAMNKDSTVSKPWLSLIVDQILTDNDELHLTSRIDLIFRTYVAEIIGIQVKAGALMRMAYDFYNNDSVFNMGNWNTQLTTNLTEQAKNSQDIINSYVKSNNNDLKSHFLNQDKNYNIDLSSIQAGESTSLQDNQIIVGLEWSMNEEGKIGLGVYYGNIDKTGYVDLDSIILTYVRGNNASQTGITGGLKMYSNELEIPDGHVITGLKTSFEEQTYHYGNNGQYEGKNLVFQITFEHSLLQSDGTLSADKAWAPLNESIADLGNVYRGSQQFEKMASPMTGLQKANSMTIYQGFLTSKFGLSS